MLLITAQKSIENDMISLLLVVTYNVLRSESSSFYKLIRALKVASNISSKQPDPTNAKQPSGPE